MSPGINFYDSANDACQNLDAQLVEFGNDNEVKAFISLLKGGSYFRMSHCNKHLKTFICKC